MRRSIGTAGARVSRRLGAAVGLALLAACFGGEATRGSGAKTIILQSEDADADAAPPARARPRPADADTPSGIPAPPPREIPSTADPTADVEAELGTVSGDTYQQLVTAVGERLLFYAPRREFSYRFRLVDQWSPNAFALPNGSIFVSRGALALTNSEDELAGILAHEITHVMKRHAEARESIARTNPFAALSFMGAAMIAAYGRDQEREADRGGQELAAAAGYDPAGIARFLRSLDHADRLLLGSARLPTFFDTHPGSIERAASTSTRGQHLEWERKPGITKNADDYLRRLRGLAIGPDPAQGVFVGNRFLHPDLDFGVSFPDGWEQVNTAQAVGALSPRRDARIVLEMAGRGDDPEAVARPFLEEVAERIGVVIDGAQPLEISGLRAYQVTGVLHTAQGPLAGMLTWIAYGGNVYRLSAAAAAAVAPQYFGRAKNAARSFRPLSPDERAEIVAKRLDLAAVRDDETLAEFSRRTGNASDVSNTAVLNGLQLGDPLHDGELLKIVIEGPYVPAKPATPVPGTTPAGRGSGKRPSARAPTSE